MNYKNGFTNIIIAVVVVVVLAGAGYYVITKNLAGDVPTSGVHIESISPTSGAVGTNITIRGSGFNLARNDIVVLEFIAEQPERLGYIVNISSVDGKTLTFPLPDVLSVCTDLQLKPGEVCQDIGVPLPEGSFDFVVINKNDISNSVSFKITDSSSVVPASGPIKINGELACLPKKGPGPHTEECAIGLKANDGRYYGLEKVPETDRFQTTGTNVEVSGTFSPKQKLGPGGAPYDVVGVIEVSSMIEITYNESATTEVRLKIGQQEGSFLLQKVFPKSVTGLNFPAYPVARDEGLPVELKIGDVVSNGCTIMLTLKRIEGDVAVFTKEVDMNKPCPICLAKNTLIDTPAGQVSVQNLKQGDEVWTIDKTGARVIGTIQKTSKVSVPETHKVVHLVLSDGRELFVSPGHPTADRRKAGDLKAGDSYDNSKVLKTELISYDGGYTYDILPSGETGFYFANGILMGSTLK